MIRIFAILARFDDPHSDWAMKIRHHFVRNAIGVCAYLLLSACGTSPASDGSRAADALPAGNYFVGTRPIYAVLVNERGGSWIFTTVTESDAAPAEGYLVRLNDLAPAFDIRTAECVAQVYPESHRCSPLNPFRDEDAGMLDRIINGSIAVGTAGKVTDLSQNYETTFDEATFNRAVDEALLNTGLDTGRHELISLLQAYDADYAAARTEFSELARQLAEAEARTDQVVLDIEPNIGGLTEYYGGDVDFGQLVSLAATGVSNAPAPALQGNVSLPCDARDCLDKASGALTALRQEIRSRQQQITSMMQPESRLYDVHCEDGVYGSYLLALACPAQIVASGTEPVSLPIEVTILSRDFDYLYPALDLADNNLSIKIQGQSVTFSNTTGEYLTLTAQSMYYNSQFNTSSSSIEIPPGISVTRKMREFASRPIDIESSYRQMTPDKAKGASFQFGFAVRYRIASNAEEHTLHDLQAFNVGCVISNQIRPGSCGADVVADARGQEPAAVAADKPRGPM